MAGTPIVSAHARVCEHIGEDTILEWRALGWTWAQIRHHLTKYANANGLDLAGKGMIGVAGLNRFLHQNPDRWERWEAATKLGAEYLVGQARRIVDKAPETQAGVAKAKARAEQRRWEAERLDVTQWGNRPAGPAINVSIGGLHLGALRALTGQPPALPAETEGEAEIIALPPTTAEGETASE